MAQVVGRKAITHDYVVISSIICNHILLHVLRLYSNEQSPETLSLYSTKTLSCPLMCVHRPLVEAGILSMPTLASRATAVSRRKRNQRASAHRLDRPVYTEKQRRGRNARTGAVTPSPAGGPPSLYLMPGLAVVGCCRQMSCTAASPDGTTHSTVVLQVDFA
jgi:hypothetical protein